MTTATLMNEQAVSCLQDLIRVNIDSAEGFQAAAELVEDDAIGAFFIRCSHERDGYVEELSTLVEVNLVEPVASGSMTGQMHRFTMRWHGYVIRPLCQIVVGVVAVAANRQRGGDNDTNAARCPGV